MLNFNDNTQNSTSFLEIFEPQLQCYIKRNRRLNHSLEFFTVVRFRETGEILDLLRIFFMIEFFVKHKKRTIVTESDNRGSKECKSVTCNHC